MSYEAYHPRSRRILLMGEKYCLVEELGGGYKDWAESGWYETDPPRSADCSLMFIQASDGAVFDSPRGSLPSDEEVAQFVTPWVVVLPYHLYRDHSDRRPNSAPPYEPIAPDEVRRLTRRASDIT